MFQGKTIAITGAGGGFGRALVLSLLDRKADVYASDLTDDARETLETKAKDKPG